MVVARLFFLVCALATLSTPQPAGCPDGFFCVTSLPASARPCACAAACPSTRADITVDATFDGLGHAWSVTTIAGNGSAIIFDGIGTNAALSNPGSFGAVFNATPNLPNLYLIEYVVPLIRAVGSIWNISYFTGGTTSGAVDSMTPKSVRFNQNRQGARFDGGSANSDVFILYVAGGTTNTIRAIYSNGSTFTFAGSTGTAGYSVDTTRALGLFNQPTGLTVDNFNVVYVANRGSNVINQIINNRVLLFAGDPLQVGGFANGVGTNARINAPYFLAITRDGATLYLADRFNHRIRVITTATGFVGTLAGNGTAAFADGVGTNAAFYDPAGLWLHSSGSLFVSEIISHRIRLVSTITGRVILIAGSIKVSPGSANGYGLDRARFNVPAEISQTPIDATILVGDTVNRMIRGLVCGVCPAGNYCNRNAPIPCNAGSYGVAFRNYTNGQCAGLCTTAPGNYCPSGSVTPFGIICPTGFFCTGGTAQPIPCLNYPGCARGSSVDVVPATPPPPCSCTAACAAASVPGSDPPALTYELNVFAGGGVGDDDGVGTIAAFSNPSLLTQMNGRTVAVNDFAKYFIRPISSAGEVTTFMKSFTVPRCGQQAPNGVIYIASSGDNKIKAIATNGVESVIAGNGSAFSIDSGKLLNASFGNPIGLNLDSKGIIIYITEAIPGNRIRVINITEGSVKTLCGSGTAAFADGLGSNARFNNPYTSALSPSDATLYVADRANNRIRAVNVSNGNVTTIAGSGAVAHINGVGTNAAFNSIFCVTLSAAGTILYAADSSNNRIRRIILATLVVDTILGNGRPGNTVGFGILSSVNAPSGLQVDYDGNLIIMSPPNKLVYIARCAICDIGMFCSSGYAQPCFAGYFGNTTGMNTNETCSGMCTAAIGFWCPAGSTNSSGVICSPGYYCAGGGDVARPCVYPALCTSSGLVIDPWPLIASITITPSSTSSQTASNTQTLSTTNTKSPSLSQTLIPTSAVSTPSPTLSLYNSSSITATSSISPTSTPSKSGTMSQSPTKTTSSSQTPSASSSYSSFPTVSSTSSQTPSSTSTPPPNSCLSRNEGCALPLLTPLSPKVPSGTTISITSPTLLIASWPFLSSSALFSLPTLPSLSETLTLRCDISPSTAAIVSLQPISSTFSLCSSSISQLCISIPSTSSTLYTPQLIQLLITPLPPQPSTTTPVTALLTCTLSSLPKLPRDLTLPLPYYGISSTLTLPLYLPISAPLLLRSIIAESRIIPGSFTVIGGVGVGLSLQHLPPSAFVTIAELSNTTLWSNSSIATNPVMFNALTTLLASLSSSSTSRPWLSTTLTGATHLLLSLINSTTSSSSRFSNATNVTLNGIPCIINWISIEGTLASITTPSLSALCDSINGVIGDCGNAILLLSEGIDPRIT